MGDFLDRGVASLGWRAVGDLAGRTREEILAEVVEAYGERGAPAATGMLFRFASEMAVGDLVLMPDPAAREVHAGRVAGRYEFRPEDPPAGGQPHVRRVEWTSWFPRDELPRRVQNQLSTLLTLSQPSAQDWLREFLASPSLPRLA